MAKKKQVKKAANRPTQRPEKKAQATPQKKQAAPLKTAKSRPLETETRIPPPKILLKNAGPKSGLVLISNVRASFVNISRPNVYKGKISFGMDILIPKTEAFAEQARNVIKAILAANTEYDRESKILQYKHAVNFGEKYSLMRDGDSRVNKKTHEIYMGHEGHWYLSAQTGADESGAEPKFPLVVVDRLGREIPSEDWQRAIYPGCYVDIQVTLKPYLQDERGGLSRYFVGVQKIADGPKFGGVSFGARDDIEGGEDESDVFGGVDSDEDDIGWGETEASGF